MKRGKVYLVGAGPSDPGLLTVKGLDCLKQADVIVYDRLLDESLLGAARPDAEKLYVGKSARRHSLEQEAINRLLVEKALQGKIVVRLKSGDPFVLGRGGEEAEALAMNQVPFEVVPGVSSAVAVPAYAGIPVTHRRLASSFTVVTGHEAADKGEATIAWDKLSTGADTLVFLMAMGNLAYIVSRLIENGRPLSTPVAVIADGTSHRQQTIVGTLEDIVSRAEQENFQPPAVIVVGEVVRLRQYLRWFDNYPLFGKRVLVTRAQHQASQLSQLLLKHGAVPVEMPTIEIQPLPAPDEFDQAILNLKDYHWIIFTSTNGVEAFFHRLYSLNLDARWLKDIRIGAIGSATAGALEQKGLRADCIPKKYTSQGLLAQLKRHDMAGCRILLPRADIAGKELTLGLTRLGAEVDEVTAYRTTPYTGGISQAKKMLLAGQIDIVTFTSSSAVANLVAALGKKRVAMNKALIACIGPATAATATKAGLRVDIVARKHTIPGLLEAIEHHFQGGGNE
ncbi:MAG: uroporphyrinogen-III C-methyltransferase [Dehalococcoidales bacterium]